MKKYVIGAIVGLGAFLLVGTIQVYADLRTEHNVLVNQYNELLDKYNGLVKKHNGLADTYNALLVEALQTGAVITEKEEIDDEYEY